MKLKLFSFASNKKHNQSTTYFVNIVIPKSGWILSKIGERTAKNCAVPRVLMRTSFQADPNANVNYYCDIQNTYFGEKTNLDIGYMTHADMDSVEWLKKEFDEKKIFKNLDAIVLMNERYRALCEKVGFPKEKITTITPGQTYDTFALRKITIGIVSRGGYPGYGQGFMEQLFSQYDVSGFRFRFLGGGWDALLPIAKAQHIDIELIPDADYSIYPKFYHDIDYLLIPGLWTAGPMSMQEALASGTPVIGADVGFVNYEFHADYTFPAGDTKRLYTILQQIRKPLIQRRKQVENMSWETYAEKLVKFFRKMEKVKLSQPMKFTYYTIIGKDINLLKGHVKNIKEYAGFDKLSCEKEFLIIVYKNKKIPQRTTDKILEFCRKQHIRTYVYEEPTTEFIKNLYTCWNLGYELATDGYVFRAGSDQVFSKDSFLHLYESAEKLRKKGINNVILQANTIENKERLDQIGAVSRHFALSLGDTYENFSYKKFESFIKKINKNSKKELIDIKEALRLWGKPTKLMTSLGNIDRVDGCSWLMTKKDWKTYGPLPVIKKGITGDVLIHDTLQKAGYIEYIVKNCITYHFVRGESINNY